MFLNNCLNYKEEKLCRTERQVKKTTTNEKSGIKGNLTFDDKVIQKNNWYCTF